MTETPDAPIFRMTAEIERLTAELTSERSAGERCEALAARMRASHRIERDALASVNLQLMLQVSLCNFNAMTSLARETALREALRYYGEGPGDMGEVARAALEAKP